jgi:hypothetical protein
MPGRFSEPVPLTHKLRAGIVGHPENIPETFGDRLSLKN